MHMFVLSYLNDNKPLSVAWTEEQADHQVFMQLELHPETRMEDYQLTPVQLPSLHEAVMDTLRVHGVKVSDWKSVLNTLKFPVTDNGILIIQAVLSDHAVFDPIERAFEILNDPQELAQTGIPFSYSGRMINPDNTEKLLEVFERE